MMYKLSFIKKAIEDYKSLDGSQRKVVDKAINKIMLNPLPNTEGGYGKPLRNQNSSELAGLLKIKIKNAGIRIVYKLIRQDDVILIIIIGARADSEVYKEAEKRLKNL